MTQSISSRGDAPNENAGQFGLATRRQQPRGSTDRLESGVRFTNLPRQVSSFIGRERELADVRRLLETTPLLTLVGAGGVGKTRLALAVVADPLDLAENSVYLVELASLADPELVPGAVATALGVHGHPGVPLLTVLVAHLQPRRVMLVLDNCEHLVQACAELSAALLHACPGLRVLATSREPLRVSGEVVWTVPSLGLATSPELLRAVDLRRHAATSLFMDRAREAQPSFNPTDAQAPAVGRICHRLDGIPLAIELAAMRVAALSPEEIAKRLEDRFRLLSTGGRAVHPRQQTLKATLDWSYNLLTDPERLLLDHLAVFAGGWTAEAAEAVCATSARDRAGMIALLVQLVSKSLVMVDPISGESSRYRLLETVRQYGLDRLAERGPELDATRRRHSAYYVDFFTRASLHTSGADQARWFARFDEEQANARSAMSWSLQTGDLDSGMRIASELSLYWEIRGYQREGRSWLTSLLDSPGSMTREVRARALRQIATQAEMLGEYADARARAEESVVLERLSADPMRLGLALHVQGRVELKQGHLDAARPLLDEAVQLLREAGERVPLAKALHWLGYLAQQQGDAAAQAYQEESLNLYRQTENPFGTAASLTANAFAAIRRGDTRCARTLLAESVQIRRAVGDYGNLPFVLEAYAAVVALEGHPERAIRLAGAAQAATDRTGVLGVDFPSVVGDCLQAARKAVGPTVTGAAYQAGRGMSGAEALADAQNESDTRRQRSSLPAGLTPREVDVLRLLRLGKTNRQIADALILSERTVHHHVESIFSKLHVSSRSAAAVFAEREGLV